LEFKKITGVKDKVNIHKTSKSLIALLIFCSSFLLFLVGNFRASSSGLTMEVGSPVYAQRGRAVGRAMWAVLGWVAGSVISGGTEAAVADALDNDEYVGSHYTATFYSSQYRRNVTRHFFRDSDDDWYGYFPADDTWRPVNTPSVAVSRTADVYRQGSGEFYWTNP
jgi:hypothetical protein